MAYDILFGCPGWVEGVIQASIYQGRDGKKMLVVEVRIPYQEYWIKAIETP